ncbi:hypothetical protein [Streptomyces sp. 21So2-11]|uniref:hypothetical protein n=1 Tax=Streptomyces sp. 21So2-11 TaxID=3144408 RepID=UPI003219AEC6
MVRNTFSVATYSSSLMPWWTSVRRPVASSRSCILAASPMGCEASMSSVTAGSAGARSVVSVVSAV